jgi:hypothetical protein
MIGILGILEEWNNGFRKEIDPPFQSSIIPFGQI